MPKLAKATISLQLSDSYKRLHSLSAMSVKKNLVRVPTVSFTSAEIDKLAKW